MSQLWNVILSEVPPERAGSASGVTTTNNSIAAALGITVLGTVLRAVDAHGAVPARWALLTAVIMLAAGVASAAALPRRRPSTGEPPAPEREAADHGRTDLDEMAYAHTRR
jgi:hypothetical protein